eukprot:TRINITY_DN47293_c0_g1_i1.p1 TRINITY_DN47293_c0_g1~~TRINITY_DN47293_c0_g1_i1.p1  ORF type:complete len:377 (-),score=54.69 TRINITY_DN47293_c0_g1_i1:59-1150(-)
MEPIQSTVDEEARAEWLAKAKAALARKAKPHGGLGVLEDWGATISSMQQTLTPKCSPVSLLIFFSDHGVKKTESQISPFPQCIGADLFHCAAQGISGTPVLARAEGAWTVAVDVGLDADVTSAVGDPEKLIAVEHRKLKRGTKNVLKAEAMTQEEFNLALATGRACVKHEVHERGARVIGIGELAVGNSTVSGMLIAALTGAPPRDVIGRGSGFDSNVVRKIDVVTRAFSFHEEAIASGDVVRILRALAGFETVAMIGAFIEAYEQGCVAIVDGISSAVGAMCASRLFPPSRSAMLFSTACEQESGHEIVMAALEAKPVLHLGLTVGESAGAALALPLLRSACMVLTEMATFEEAFLLTKSVK